MPAPSPFAKGYGGTSITQRGNRRQKTFFRESDYRAYLDLLVEWCGKYEVRIWACCLMPNHVHLIVVPPTAEALCPAIGEAHRRYTRMVNSCLPAGRSARAGGGICGKAGSRRSRWMAGTCWLRRGTSSGIRSRLGW